MLRHLAELTHYLTLKGLAPSSISEITSDIRLIERHIFPLHLHLLDQAHLEDALLSLKEAHNLKNVTFNRKISSLKSFFAFLHERRHIPHNPAGHIPSARRIRNAHPVHIVKAELQSFLSCALRS